MHIEQMAVSALRPYAKNARTHSRKQIRQIAKSIERFGFCNPVLIDDDNQIIAGHGRVEAAKLLKMDSVPVVRLSHLSGDEKRAYILADNRLAEKAGWDREILSIEFQHLVDVGFDVELTGFDTADIDLLMEDLAENNTADDVAPAYPKGPPVSLPGDLWLLGKHMLLCGDARTPTSYAKLMGVKRAEFVISDCPYNIRMDGFAVGSGRIHHADFVMASGEMSRAEFTSFLRSVFEHLCRHSTDGSIHELFMDWRHLREMLDAAEAVYSELKNLVIWNKSIAGMG
ncbi:MAG: ParB N-terminal domain-containing protein, partial [Terriglobia bacterium]